MMANHDLECLRPSAPTHLNDLPRAVKWKPCAQDTPIFGEMITQEIGFFQLYTANALHWLNWIEREHDNIRATLAWHLTTPQGVERQPMMVNVLVWFWYRRGYTIEGSMWADRLLAAPSMQAPSPARDGAVRQRIVAMWQGKQDVALAKVQESLAIVQLLEIRNGLPSCSWAPLWC
jgi:hypothetical protein